MSRRRPDETDEFGVCEVPYCKRHAVTEVDDDQVCIYHARHRDDTYDDDEELA